MRTDFQSAQIKKIIIIIQICIGLLVSLIKKCSKNVLSIQYHPTIVLRLHSSELASQVRLHLFDCIFSHHPLICVVPLRYECVAIFATINTTIGKYLCCIPACVVCARDSNIYSCCKGGFFTLFLKNGLFSILMFFRVNIFEI